ncbi:hypothetical protein PG995_004135 [Apiospora arundinis]
MMLVFFLLSILNGYSFQIVFVIRYRYLRVTPVVSREVHNHRCRYGCSAAYDGENSSDIRASVENLTQCRVFSTLPEQHNSLLSSRRSTVAAAVPRFFLPKGGTQRQKLVIILEGDKLGHDGDQTARVK